MCLQPDAGRPICHQRRRHGYEKTLCTNTLFLYFSYRYYDANETIRPSRLCADAVLEVTGDGALKCYDHVGNFTRFGPVGDQLGSPENGGVPTPLAEW